MVSGIAAAMRAKARGLACLFAMALAAACAAPSMARGETDETLDRALALAEAPPAMAQPASDLPPDPLELAENPPAFDVAVGEPAAAEAPGSGDPVNLLIAAHRTPNQRYSDT